MFSFFGTKKPRQFNYKPVYLKDESEKQEEFSFGKHKNYSDLMYQRWDRVSYKELLAKGKKRTLTTMIALVFILILIILNLEKLNVWLAQFEK
jgi:hypothetical protein